MEIKAQIKGKALSLIMDETPNKRNQPVVNIIACFPSVESTHPGPSYHLLCSATLNGPCTTEAMKQLLDDTLQTFELSYAQVLALAR